MRKVSYMLEGSLGRRIPADVFDTEDSPKATVVYLHGFGGFKDWGDNEHLATMWLAAGVRYIRFNFSLNGTSPEHPTEFIDLEGFASNNYSHMLFDLGQVLSWLASAEFETQHSGGQRAPLVLVGHSMGGTVALLAACEFEAVDAAISWAAPAACKTPWERWSAEQLRQWQLTGVQYYLNGRNRQKIPLHYQLYRDYESNASRFDLESRLAGCQKPLLLVHGREDASVLPAAVELLASWAPGAQVCMVGGDHTFNRKHPAAGRETTDAMESVMHASLSFVSSLIHN